MKPYKLRKVYQGLSLICYNQKYLIPQRPFPPLSCYIAYFNLIRKRNPKGKDGQGPKPDEINQLVKNNIANGHPQFLKIKAEYEKASAQFSQKLKKYTQEYLDPPIIFKTLTPITVFVTEQFSNTSNSPIKLGEISKAYSRLGEEEKLKYKQKCQQERSKLLPRYNQYMEKHLIPKFSLTHPTYTAFRLFQTENYGSTGHKNYREAQKEKKKQFEQLSQMQKKILQSNAQQKNQQAKQNYEQFLKKWKINHKQLEFIIDISKQYDEMKAAAKTLKFKQKLTVIDEIDLETETDNQKIGQEDLKKN